MYLSYQPFCFYIFAYLRPSVFFIRAWRNPWAVHVRESHDQYMWEKATSSTYQRKLRSVHVRESYDQYTSEKAMRSTCQRKPWSVHVKHNLQQSILSYSLLMSDHLPLLEKYVQILNIILHLMVTTHPSVGHCQCHMYVGHCQCHMLPCL